MTPKTRRDFLTTTACSGVCLLACHALARGEERPKDEAAPGPKPTTPDFGALAYCLAECTPESCPLLKATLADDREIKARVAERWQQKLGRRVAPEEVFCYGCKTPLEKQGPGIRACTVRPCVLERKLVSCAHCRELASCQKELWLNYPEHRKRVLAVQRQILG